MKKKKINNMTEEELKEYVDNLPDEIPPSWSSAGMLGGLGVVGMVAFIFYGRSWFWLGVGLLSLLGAGYLAYKILTFGNK